MARIRSLFKWGIFLSSFIPLYLILSYKHIGVQASTPSNIPFVGGAEVPILTVFWLVLSMVSLTALGLVLNVRKSKEPEPKNVIDATNRNEAVTSYILVYIFPFVVLDLSQVVNWIAFIIFFAVIGIIQVRSNHLYVNPILALAGYNIYDVSTEDEEMTLLVNGRIDDRPAEVSAVKLSYGVYIAV
ncbi:hypothetical protein [Natrinema salsiterrestre]|uniref:Uncharacterized protein n=1 Tax=Natrinema salsiterrestre TaxID=2950540 RepID=A0A9Q4L854_9EURY|nr:hypothetical protein [Natrinema salsiterrestre]MDF9748302.1 hypothetical protein [Natrinema salsiterrestre]